ncbi:CBS pair associated ParBc domain-containing protein [Halorutilales archaeon Cl-col2-1]
MPVSSKPLVKDYMTKDVVTASPDDTVGDVIEKVIENEGHSGFPVTEAREVKGFITAEDMLGKDDDEPIFRLMSTDPLVAEPEMSVTDAARVILRSGIQKLPVVDDADNLVGIISNSDVIRSQIERVTPQKVWKLMDTLESIHGIDLREERRRVEIDHLVPTQDKVYADELQGRSYELERDLVEPLIVIEKKTDGKTLLVDGHHRVVAAHRSGVEEMDAYVVVVEADVELGMEKTAEESGLETIDDIEVVDYAKHPLNEATNIGGK